MAKRPSYWAVRPISTRDSGQNTRIAKAPTAREACILAFGRIIIADTWEAKNLGTRVIQSDTKRVSLLRDPAGWVKIEGDREFRRNR